jgi:hypothetical protein
MNRVRRNVTSTPDMEVNQQSWAMSNFKHINLFWSIFYSVHCAASHLLHFDVYHSILGICDILIVRMDDIEFLGYLSIVYMMQRIWRCKDDCLFVAYLMSFIILIALIWETVLALAWRDWGQVLKPLSDRDMYPGPLRYEAGMLPT